MYFRIYIPAGVLGLIMVGLLLLAAHAGLYYFNRWYRRHELEHNNEAAGIIFGVLTLIYSLLIAFVFVAVWENHQDLNRTIEHEADDLNSVLVHSTVLPDSLQVPVRAAIKSYCEAVVGLEWHMVEGGDRSQSSTLPALRMLLFQVEAENKIQESVLSVLDENLVSISNLRRERLSHTRSHVPSLVWMILVFGTMIVILFSYFLQMESERLKRIFLSFLWIMIGMSLYLVYMLDKPFIGSTQVSKAPYEEIIKWLEKPG
jgi:Protein of unknown function (DUF4239)